MVKISVVVPVRDDPRIDDLLDSFASQIGAPPFEVLVALDGARREPLVPASLPARLLRLPKRGPYAARNAAIREARGEILLFTDLSRNEQDDTGAAQNEDGRMRKEKGHGSGHAEQGGVAQAQGARIDPGHREPERQLDRNVAGVLLEGAVSQKKRDPQAGPQNEEKANQTGLIHAGRS